MVLVIVVEEVMAESVVEVVVERERAGGGRMVTWIAS